MREAYEIFFVLIYSIVSSEVEVVSSTTISSSVVDDSSLEDIRLDLPFTFRLHKALKEEGLNVQYENSVEEMVKKICQ